MAKISVVREGNSYRITLKGRLTASDLRRLERAGTRSSTSSPPWSSTSSRCSAWTMRPVGISTGYVRAAHAFRATSTRLTLAVKGEVDGGYRRFAMRWKRSDCWGSCEDAPGGRLLAPRVCGAHRESRALGLRRCIAGALHDWQARVFGKRRINRRALTQIKGRSTCRLNPPRVLTIRAQPREVSLTLYPCDVLHLDTITHLAHDRSCAVTPCYLRTLELSTANDHCE